ncbi:MAG: uracil-DNA glycosylase family protein [Acidimicrobiales bacterium]
MSSKYWKQRGVPWEYDPGPARNRRWARLFSETPNYRAFGKAVTGREEFRWHFGPMYYRGRLGDNKVKVLVIGQEGAQDESLSHRSFTGGTGGRMQNLLNHLGITRSYLFMNTFVYPIFGQYDGDNRLIAQHPDSPARQHREELFDYVVARNDLQLVVAVGLAAKESVASWVESHGGTASPSALHKADASVISPNLHLVGVMHPGGAGKGGAVTKIKASFVSAIKEVEKWATADPNWLPVDSDGTREPAGAYKYSSDPIPFRDFPYGSPWRLGRGATSSNRKDRQQSIQMFGQGGKYGNKGHRLKYQDDASGSDEGYQDDPGDLVYEPPKKKRDYDKGPGSRFAALLQGGKPGFPWPDFNSFGLKCNQSFGAGPIYRGRLYSPSILVLADQQSHDDLFTARALTGDAGQHLQAFLAAAGLTRSYGILRVLPVDTLEDDRAAVFAAVDSPEVRALYAEAIERARPQVLLFVGPLAKRLTGHVNPDGLPAVTIRAHDQSGVNANWRSGLAELAALDYDRDIASPSFDFSGERLQIPRGDLPYGTLRWQATSGSRGLQPKKGSKFTYDYYKYVMPDWADRLDPSPLSNSEKRAADILRDA